MVCFYSTAGTAAFSPLLMPETGVASYYQDGSGVDFEPEATPSLDISLEDITSKLKGLSPSRIYTKGVSLAKQAKRAITHPLTIGAATFLSHASQAHAKIIHENPWTVDPSIQVIEKVSLMEALTPGQKLLVGGAALLVLGGLGIGYLYKKTRTPNPTDAQGEKLTLARRLELVSLAVKGDKTPVGDFCKRTGITQPTKPISVGSDPDHTTTFIIRPAFRPKIQTDNVRFGKGSQMPDGTQLTFERLVQAGLEPRSQLNIEGREMWVSQAYHIQTGGRVAFMAYVKDDNGSWVVRSYYLSNSHGVWKLLSHYVRFGAVGSYYGKGISEDSVSLPISAQRAFYQLLASQGDVLDLSHLNNPSAQELFYGTASPKKKIVLDKPPGWTPDMTYMYEVSPNPGHVVEGGNKLEAKWPDPKTVRPGMRDGDASEPKDFNRPVESFPANGFTAEVFVSRDGRYRYLILRDSEDHVYIAIRERTKSKVGTTGVYVEWLDNGFLTMPLIEHVSGIDDEYIDVSGEAYGVEYIPTFPYIRQIPIIQRYYRERGIKIPA